MPNSLYRNENDWKKVKTQIKNPKCKKCTRTPSIMGKEPMYLIPFNSIYFVLCGSCFNKLLNHFGNFTPLDFSNLFTHKENYHNFIKQFLNIK